MIIDKLNMLLSEINLSFNYVSDTKLVTIYLKRISSILNIRSYTKQKLTSILRERKVVLYNLKLQDLLCYYINALIINHINKVKDLKNFDLSIEEILNLCGNSYLIAKHLIKLLKISKNVNKQIGVRYRNPYCNYNIILDNYLIYYHQEEINFSNMNIKSFPIYPNMKVCSVDSNKLRKFPIQPEMTHCNISGNSLATFPIQPKMKHCNISNNRLTTFSIQPKMINCNISDNRLTELIVHPEMKYCNISNNRLISQLNIIISISENDDMDIDF